MKMKKVINFCIALLLLMCSCNKGASLVCNVSYDDTLTVENFLDVAKKDFEPYSKKYAVFYESQITFTNDITSDSVNIEHVMNVVQNRETCVQIHHQDGKSYTISTEAWWLEDMPINLDEIISLDSAITRLQMADIVKPKSRYCVLRNILGPKPTTPAYIFGTVGTSFVRVDAITGDVSSIE